MPSPEISECASNLLSPKKRKKLEIFDTNRKISVSKMKSVDILEVANFCAIQGEVINNEIHKGYTVLSELANSYKAGEISLEQYDEAATAVKEKLQELEPQRKRLKSQTKFIEDDIRDCLGVSRSNYTTLENAYTTAIAEKVMTASKLKTGKNTKSHKQQEFKMKLFEYYAAQKVVNEVKLGFCHLTGWQPFIVVKAAHIIPKSLGGESLAYIFGVQDGDMANDCGNGLVLHHVIEEQLDVGGIVIVPVKDTNPLDFKLVVADKSILSNMIFPGIFFRDIDGKLLDFNSENRPAKRNLYFRFAITCFHQKQRANIEYWDEMNSKGYIWATPGPYLRKSMLKTLARNISDRYLPEVFFQDTTFSEDDGFPSMSEENEDNLATELKALFEDSTISKHESDDESDSEEDD